jgi:predicted enzyme related to lactoylglutathione lyase
VKEDGSGYFVWYDLMTTDPDVTDRFYNRLFGWSVDPEVAPGTSYQRLSNQGVDFGGRMSWDAVMGIPSHWLAYIQVDDLDATVDTATQLGAPSVIGPMEIPGVGRFSILTDPSGASFIVFAPLPPARSEQPSYDGPAGSVVWIELITRDLSRSVEFYARLFGWQTDPAVVESGGYVIAHRNGIPVAGIFRPPADPEAALWMIYFNTANIESSLSTAKAGQGKIIHATVEIPGIGKTAWVADPASAVFGLMQPEPGWLQRL